MARHVFTAAAAAVFATTLSGCYQPTPIAAGPIQPPYPGCAGGADFPTIAHTLARPDKASQNIQFFGAEADLSSRAAISYTCTCETGVQPDKITAFQAKAIITQNLAQAGATVEDTHFSETNMGKTMAFVATMPSSPWGKVEMHGRTFYLPECTVVLSSALTDLTIAADRARAMAFLETAHLVDLPRSPVATGATALEPSTSAHPIAVHWEGYRDLIAGTIELQQGRLHALLPDNEGKCEGTFSKGAWSMTCSNGMAAAGTYHATGSERGATGTGTDNRGRQINFTMGGALEAASVTPQRGQSPIAVSATIAATSRLAAHPPGVPMGLVEFKAPPIGTIFRFSDGGFYQVVSVSGTTLRTRGNYVYGGFLASKVQLGFGQKIEALWPLEVGKSADFDYSGRGADGIYGTWHHTISVLREDDLPTEFGTLRTFVIENRDRSLGAGNYEGRTTYWYAPDMGFPVRVKYEVVRGVGKPFDITLSSVSKQ